MYAEKGAIAGIWSALSIAEVRKSGNNLADARNEVGSYIGAITS